jgi:hypothetical protein
MSLLLYSLYESIGVTSNVVAACWQYVIIHDELSFWVGKENLFALSRREHLKSPTYPIVWFILLAIIRVFKALNVLWAGWVISLEDLENRKNFGL